MLTPPYKRYKGAKRIINHLGTKYPYPSGVNSNYKTFYTEKSLSKEKPFNIELERW